MKPAPKTPKPPRVADTHRPYIVPDRTAKLTPEEKNELRALLNSRVYRKMLSIVAMVRPSSNCTGAGSRERDQFSEARANARLGEMRGWDLYDTAIFASLNDAPPERKAVTESFPDSGRLDAGWGQAPVNP